mgnify:CR=1 FL=1
MRVVGVARIQRDVDGHSEAPPGRPVRRLDDLVRRLGGVRPDRDSPAGRIDAHLRAGVVPDIGGQVHGRAEGTATHRSERRLRPPCRAVKTDPDGDGVALSVDRQLGLGRVLTGLGDVHRGRERSAGASERCLHSLVHTVRTHPDDGGVASSVELDQGATGPRARQRGHRAPGQPCRDGGGLGTGTRNETQARRERSDRQLPEVHAPPSFETRSLSDTPGEPTRAASRPVRSQGGRPIRPEARALVGARRLWCSVGVARFGSQIGSRGSWSMTPRPRACLISPCSRGWPS